MTMLRAIAISTLLALPASALAQANADEQIWADALAQGSIAAFERYLESYPDGRHAASAFRCRIELTLMPTGHLCSVDRNGPGPSGPVRSRIGNFAITLR